jgi:hypothetical protein
METQETIYIRAHETKYGKLCVSVVDNGFIAIILHVGASKNLEMVLSLDKEGEMRGLTGGRGCGVLYRWKTIFTILGTQCPRLNPRCQL